MNKILAICFMFGLGSVANAASSSNIGVLESSITVNTVAISSFSPTDVSPASIVMNDRTSLVVQNLDSTATIYCSEKTNLTTSSNSFMLVPGGGMISLNIRTYSQYLKKSIKIYCLTSSTSGSTNVAVIQAY